MQKSRFGVLIAPVPGHCLVVSSPEPKANKVSLKDGTLAGVRVCVLTISNMDISKTRWPIATKFYLKHHWGSGKPA